MVMLEEQDIYTQLGQQISNARKRLKITQDQLAEKVGLSQPTLASYEIGRRKIPIPILLKITDSLGVELEEFFPFMEKKKPGPTSKVDTELAKVKVLPAKQQKIILDLIESVIANTP
ncbi:MAG: helix-turn-helix transcriptional regulator [Spirochaetaceae bacterium]|jgi:transcriptional regulator with XRE-family HTH domain|nr:helix-turn-helix transcriptional regulator [Spirochaetaceae bacterium]